VHESYCILDDAIKYGVPQGNTHYNFTIRVGVNNEIRLKSCRFRKFFPTEITTTKDLRCKYGDVSFVPAADFRHQVQQMSGCNIVVDVGSGDSGKECVAAAIASSTATKKGLPQPKMPSTHWINGFL